MVFGFKPDEGGVYWMLISDYRKLNQWFTRHPFKLDHMQQNLPSLKKWSWGAKVDLKYAYFHIPIHSDLKQFLSNQVGKNV
jgi:hypothetical protein